MKIFSILFLFFLYAFGDIASADAQEYLPDCTYTPDYPYCNNAEFILELARDGTVTGAFLGASVAMLSSFLIVPYTRAYKTLNSLDVAAGHYLEHLLQAGSILHRDAENIKKLMYLLKVVILLHIISSGSVVTFFVGFSIGSLLGSILAMTYGILIVIYNNYSNLLNFFSITLIWSVPLIILQKHAFNFHTYSPSPGLPVGN